MPCPLHVYPRTSGSYLVQQVHQKQQDGSASNGGQHDDPQRNNVRFRAEVPGNDVRIYLVASDLGQFALGHTDVRQLGDFG